MTRKVGDTWGKSQDPKQAKEWFGANPLKPVAQACARAQVGSGAEPPLPTCAPTGDETAHGLEQRWHDTNVGMPHPLVARQHVSANLYLTCAANMGTRSRSLTGWKLGDTRHHERAGSTTRLSVTWWLLCSGCLSRHAPRA